MRIRHFGFLANRAKKQALPQCRKLLGLSSALPELPKKSARDLLLELTGIDLSRCPRCQKGTMIVVGELPLYHPHCDGIPHDQDSTARKPIELSTRCLPAGVPAHAPPGGSTGAKKWRPSPIAPSPLQKIDRHRTQPSLTCGSTATKAPRSALLRHFTICIAATDALLRGLVQHVLSPC